MLSVANQRYKNIEHIIVDSTSSDKTVSLILACQKKFNHIRLISERDRGAYPAMNKGIDMSNGKWIYFLGGDDQLVEENTLAELFHKGVFSKYQVVYGNVLIKGNATWAKDQDIYDGPFDLQKLLNKNICHQAIFYPRRLVRKVGYFNPDYTITADWDYNLRCYVETDFFHIDQTIAIFNAGGLSTKKGKDVLGTDFSQNVIQYFKLNPFDPSLLDPDNPFFNIIERFHKSESAKQDKEIVIETDEQTTESLSILEQQELIIHKQEVIKNQQELVLQKEKRILDQGGQIAHLNETIKKQKDEMAGLDGTIKEQRSHLSHQDESIKEQREQMVHQYEAIKKQIGQVVKLDEVNQNQHQLIQKKEELIHQQQEQFLKLEQVIKEQQELIRQKDNTISRHQEQILQKDQTIKEKQDLILEKEKLAVRQEDQMLQQQISLKNSNDLVLQKEELIIRHENLILKNEEIIQKQVDQIRDYNERISGLSNQVEENEKLISTYRHREQELEKIVEDQTRSIEEKETVIEEKQGIIEEKDLIIEWKEKELSTVYHSFTWHIGKVLLSPFTFIHRRFRKTSG